MAGRGNGRVSGTKRQRGVAVLTAMLVVTVGTLLAVELMWDATLDQRRTAAALAADQGLMFALGAEAWAADILRQDLVDSDESDHAGEEWAVELPPLPVDGGSITGRLEDLQGRFNLNNLIGFEGAVDELALRQFERLLSLLELDPTLAPRVVDWLDIDAEASFPIGAEDAAYAGSEPPYRTPNSMITSATELMAIDGFDVEAYRQLSPYVAALPIGTPLNVNTASAVVLASLSEEIDIATAEGLVEQRAGVDFVDLQASFEGLLEPDVLERIDGVSSHFLLTARVALGTNQLALYSVLQRDASGLTRTIFRSLGVP
jgi:general secretion pathway protein K